MNNLVQSGLRVAEYVDMKYIHMLQYGDLQWLIADVVMNVHVS
jgi:hypothetical protein